MTAHHNAYAYPPQHETLNVLVDRYERELSQSVDQHDIAAVTSHKAYTRQIDELSAGPFSEARLRKVVDGRDKKLDQQFAKDRADVADVIGRYGNDVESALSPSDRQVLAHAQAHARKYGVGHYGVADILQGVSFRERQAIKVALDREVQTQVEALARKHGVNHYSVADALLQASSFQVKKAIMSMLDGYALAEAQKLTRQYGAGDYRVADALVGLSYNIRSVIKTTLDSDTLSRAQRSARKYGADDYRTQDVIRQGSAWPVQSLIQTFLKGQEPDSGARAKAEGAYGADFTEEAGAYNLFKGFFKKRFGRGRKSKEEPTSKQQGEGYDDFYAQYHRYYEEYANRQRANAGNQQGFFTEDRYAGANTGSQSTGARGARAGYQAPKAESAPEPERPKFARDDPEVGPIVRAVVDRDRSRRWLLEAPAGDVRRVLATVQALRAKAKEEGRVLTDGAIYRKYRNKIEIGEGDADRQVNPQTQASFMVLDALMGGFRGKIPDLPEPPKSS